jgi:pyrophosphatase PpaX
MKDYQYFLFDWDGCLAKTLDLWLDCFRQAYASYGKHPSDQEIARHFGDYSAPALFGISDVEACGDKAAELAHSNLQTVELYGGAKELLTTLKASKKIALLSSSRRYVIDWGLQHNGLENMFDLVLTADDVSSHKPDPEAILTALDRFGASKEQAVMIGDSRKDLGCAQNAGVDSILVYPEEHRVFYDLDELKTYEPTYVVGGFGELKQRLQRPR